MLAKLTHRLHWHFIVACLGTTLFLSALAGLGSLYSAFTGPYASRYIDSEQVSDVPQRLAPAAEGWQFDWLGAANVTVEDPSTYLALLSVLPSSLAAIATFTVALLLLQMLGDLQRGSAFSPFATQRMRLVAGVVAVAGVVVPLASSWADYEYLRRAAAPGTEFARTVDFSLPVWAVLISMLAAGLVAALAQVFAEGRRLKVDTEGLV